MFLNLALEYIDALNSKETPTVLTALDRVVQSETVKILDQTFDLFKQDCQEVFSEEQLPLPSKDFHKSMKKLMRKHKLQL
jgi:hypothetical protein